MQPAVPVQGEQQVDLNAAMWVSVQKAASESRWIPSEYYQNEWVADVCAFLRDGHPRQLVPVPTETLYAMLEAITTAMDNKSVPGAWLVIANNAGCEFVDSLTRTQSPEAFTPNRPCKSPDLCRKSGFCDDAWHCSTQRQEAGHD
jgi:hypothetical protein